MTEATVTHIANNRNDAGAVPVGTAVAAHTRESDGAEIQDVYVSNLPPGAATSAKQDDLLTELQKKADLTETQPISAASLPLPSGAATSANQTNGAQVTRLTDEYGFSAEFTPMGETRFAESVRLVGAQFEGTTVDPNFWTATVANSATITQANAQIVLTSGTNSAGSAKFNSVKRARYVGGSAQRFRAAVQLGDTGAADNVRRWGVAWGATMPTITDGAYFQLSGTTFSVVTLKGSSPTVVNSGSFNGTLGATYTPGTSVVTFEIYWTNSRVYFVVGDEILHTVSASAATWAATVNHHIYLENTNSGNTTSVTLSCRVVTIARLGRFETEPKSYFQVGTTAGVVLKYGPGNIHGISISAVTQNSVVTLYDNTAASGTVLWSSGAMGAQTIPFSIDMHNIPFSNGLTLVIASANSSALVAYE